MRASTAAGINPCVRTPPPAYMSSGCHRMQLRGISRLAFAGGAVREGISFPGVCWLRWCCLGKGPLVSGIREEFAVSVSAVVLYEEVSFWRLYGVCRWCRTGKRSLFPGIFGIRHIRYRRRHPVVRNMPPVRRTALWCTRFRGALRQTVSSHTEGRGPRCTQQPRLFSSVPKEGNSRFLIAYCARFHIFVNGQRKGYEKERPQRSHQGRHQVLLGD